MTLFTLATLAEFRAYLSLESGADAPLCHALRAATAHLEARTQRRLAPWQGERSADLLLHDLRECLLPEDLLELHACEDAFGHPVPLDDLLLLHGSILHRLHGRFPHRSTPIGAVRVRGIWGWHPDWAQAWRDTSDLLLSAVDADDAVLPMVDVDGPDAALLAPRFSVGQLLRLEAEYCVVLRVDAAANALHVQRGAHGTTAAAHPLHTPAARYLPPPHYVQSCLRYAAFFYRQPLGEAEALPTDAPPPRPRL
jgi:hypothetical protein